MSSSHNVQCSLATMHCCSSEDLPILQFPCITHHQIKVRFIVNWRTDSRVVVHKLLLRHLVTAIRTRTALGRAHWPFTSDNGVSTPQNLPSTCTGCTWDFPDVIKFRVAVHTLWEKAIRFRHLDYDPDRVQKLISSSMSRHLSTCKNVIEIHARIFAIRQTDKHCGQSHLPPPLSEVNYHHNS